MELICLWMKSFKNRLNKMQKNIPKNFFPKTLMIVIVATTLSLAPVKTQKAEAFWGEIMQQFLKQALELIQDNIQGIIMGELKQIAAKTMNEEVANLVSGSSSQDSKIIGNYKEFLHTDPKKETDRYMKELLTDITGGRGSLSNYIPSGEGFGGGNGGSYNAQLVEMVQNSVINTPTPTVDYIGDPRQNLFDEPGNLDKYVSGINYPLKLQVYTQQKYQERLEIEKDAARTEAIAGQGFKGTRKGDTIITPGSLIGDNMADVMDLGNKVIAGAQSIPETITAVVTQVIAQTIENGVGKASENVQREGPKSDWVNPDTQKTTTAETSDWINPDTNKPGV